MDWYSPTAAACKSLHLATAIMCCVSPLADLHTLFTVGAWMSRHLDNANWLAIVTGVVECLVKMVKNELQIRMQTLAPIAQAMSLIN